MMGSDTGSGERRDVDRHLPRGASLRVVQSE
jgi:hypothetical protein